MEVFYGYIYQKEKLALDGWIYGFIIPFGIIRNKKRKSIILQLSSLHLKTQLVKSHLALFGANFIYGVNYLIAKGLMPDKIKPSGFVLMRVVGATLLFWSIKVFVKEKIANKDLVKIGICGLFGVVSNQLFFFHGLNLTSPIDASIIITAVPVLVFVLSSIFLKEQITKNKIGGLLIGGLGAVILIWQGSQGVGTGSIAGNLLVFANTCAYAIYLVSVKPLMQKYHPITVVSWAFFFGMLILIPIGAKDIYHTSFADFDLSTYLAVGFVVVFTTFFAYLFNIYALNHVSPSVNGSYIYLQPVVSFIAVSSYAFLSENSKYQNDITTTKLISCLLVVTGVWLISKKPKII